MPAEKKIKKTEKKKPEKRIMGKGWATSDADEIIRRQLRAENEIIHVKPLDGDFYYGSFIVYSDGREDHDNAQYLVEIRSLDERLNSCNCLDFKTNGLGTCKHIEKVLLNLKKKGNRIFAQAAARKSPWVEIFLHWNADLSAPAVNIKWPEDTNRKSKLFLKLDRFFSQNGCLLGDPVTNVLWVKHVLEILGKKDRNTVRYSAHLDDFVADLQTKKRAEVLRDDFLADIKTGKRNFDYLKHSLYPYQQDGILHLAFNRRALLGDEMGLGKTVQAIGACELLRRTQGIERVLIIATASLKTEWEEQIAKFTSSSSVIIQGSKQYRLKQYCQPAFYYLANYEQILFDSADIQRLLMPDVIILDEAQRIKNWHTKTAKAVKMLSSPYAFVLTGTPLENRIDDIYSIVQFLNPHLFGSLFRFNREFYTLDEKGRSAGYKNMDKLHRQLKPVLLRRKKIDVEEQLPEVTVNHYFVPMDRIQINRYGEYEKNVAQLVRIAKTRPLRKEEFEKLQKWLACMRMLCDTPFILDENCKVSPKLDELEKILEELLEDSSTKIIIFSEWARMLMLIRELVETAGIGYAWHTGSVPQNKRREEINRFKQDPACRLFLSTDSGSVGLNLQAANVVINMDLPWNPAKLEQRIARAWRKHQKRNVQVINLVSEGTIEHRMISLLNQKATLAKNILHDGNIKEMELPSGRNAFMEKMEELMDMPNAFVKEKQEKPESFDEEQALYQFKIAVLADCQEQLISLDLHQQTGRQKKIIFAVIKTNDENIKQIIQQRFQEAGLGQLYEMEIADTAAYAMIKRLESAGIIQTSSQNSQSLFEMQPGAETRLKQQSARINKSRDLLSKIDRQRKLSELLINGGFCQEGLAPLRETVDHTLTAFSYANNIIGNPEEKFTLDLKDKMLEVTDIENSLFEQSLQISNSSEAPDAQIQEWLKISQALFNFVEENLNKLALKVF